MKESCTTENDFSGRREVCADDLERVRSGIAAARPGVHKATLFRKLKKLGVS
jgi:transcriptional regulator of acetoin/glycerol metabolism